MRLEMCALALGTALAACALAADAVAQTPAADGPASALATRILPELAGADRSPAEPGSLAQAERVGPVTTSLLARAQVSLLESEHARPEPAPLLQRRDRKRQTGVTLMIVGGAAFVTGLVIGDTGGTILAVAGIGVGAYGLYLFIE